MSQKKKYSWLAALLSATLFLCSCSKEDTSSDSTGEESSSSIISSSTGETSTSGEQNSGKEPETDSLPRMDGSTSAIPLEIGLKSGFLGISYTQAKEMVSHTTTHDSFKRLINGEVDLIFSVPISEEQQKAADDAGIKLFMEPVAREGFVFVVNANNPIDSLTSEQLRKIYSGEITNWSQVGGNDEPILPYQRNFDSGSQNYMTVFMEDVPLMPPKTELVAIGMGGLMDAVAVYDNSEGAIGYSVYSYAAQMYANANKVKFLAVDGVAPSKATMADESYPLLSCTYMIYTDKSPESAGKFVEKALSDEGQGYVLDSGYLPVNGMEVPEKYLPYEAVGTGEKRPADFKPSNRYSALNFYIRGEDEKAPIIKTGSSLKLDFLKDSELQSRINADISEAIKRFVANGNAVSDNEIMWQIDSDTICRNGYLSIILTRKVSDLYGVYSQAETLNYDLFSGKKIERFSDLFYEGEDFVPDVNKRISEELNAQAADYFDFSDNEPKLDFSGILGEPRLFTINSVGLEPDNMYFTYGQFIRYFNEYNDVRECDLRRLATQYRDMKEIIRDEWAELIYESSYNEWETEYVTEDGDVYLRVVGSQFHTDEEVKAEDKFRYELQRRAWEHLRKAIPDYNSRGAIDYRKRGNYYSVGNRSFIAEEDRSVNFDADTLEIITLEMLVGKNWQQYLTDEYKEFAELELYPTVWYGDETVDIYAYSDTPTESGRRSAYLNVPREKINKRYLNAEENN